MYIRNSNVFLNFINVQYELLLTSLKMYFTICEVFRLD